MHTFIIPMSTIHAVLPTIPKTDVRFYLVGALVDLDAGRIVVTDGHRMIVCDGPKLAGGGQHIVPRDILATVAKVKKCESVTLSLADTGNGGVTRTFQLTAGSMVLGGVTIEGRFPDYARVIPRQFSQKVAQYNADYLADAQAALAEYHGINIAKNPPRMEHNGDSPGIMHVNRPGCFVVVMPMRTDSAMERDMAAFIGCVTDTAPQAAAA